MDQQSVEFPRVLVISHNPFSCTLNNGKTLSTLFSCWPQNRLAQIYLNPTLPDSPVCMKYWRVSEQDILLSLLTMGFHKPGGVIRGKQIGKNSAIPSTCVSTLSSKLRRLNSPTIEVVRECLWMIKNWWHARLKSWISEFKPELVYFLAGGSVFSYDLALTITRELNLPLVLHFTDDYFGIPVSQHPFTLILNKMILNRLYASLEISKLRIVIGDAMVEEFQRRYGKDFIPFMACLKEEDISSAVRKRPNNGITRLVYLGGLHLDRWRSLQSIGKALIKIREEMGILSELLIYSSKIDMQEYGGRLRLDPVIRVEGWVPANDVPQVIADADILVHAESFDLHNRHYTRLSVSTKIPEYLMSGRCIFAYGPEEIASMRYISENRVGVTVGKEDFEALKNQLRKVIEDSSLRQSCIERAKKLAISRHVADKVCSDFCRALSTVVA